MISADSEPLVVGESTVPADRSAFIEHAAYGIYWCTTDGRFLQANGALAAMLGYDSPDEILGLNMYTDVYVCREDREQVIRQYRRAKVYKDVEVQWKRRDGTIIQVVIGGRPLRDVSGDIVGFEDIVQDVSEQRALEEQVRQLQRVQAMGRLAGGVAHDFNNILTSFFGHLTILERASEDVAPVRTSINGLRQAAERARSLVQQLLAFSRSRPVERQVVSLRSVVKGAHPFLAQVLGPQVRLEMKLTDREDQVRADPFQLEQVLLNLAVNARDAMPEGGRLRFETQVVRLNEREARSRDLRRGTYVRLRVEDDGIGMSTETASKALEPFFTTKRPGEGTGLGLSIVYGIIVQTGGRIFVNSSTGQGTTFDIWFPRAEGPACAPAPAGAGAPASSTEPERPGNATILVVEDEADVRALLAHFLREAGYGVVEAASGVEGLAAFREARQEIALIVTDILMPELNGYLMAARITGMLGKRLPVIYVSGYADTVTIPPGATHAMTRFLEKPIDMDRLVETVGQLLG